MLASRLFLLDNVRMGRQNSLFRHSARVLVEVDAPNAAEASRRVGDAVDALQMKHGNAEIYRRQQEKGQSGSRIPGRPRILAYVVDGGLPTEVDPFERIDGSLDVGGESSTTQTDISLDDVTQRYKDALELLATAGDETMEVRGVEMTPAAWVIEVANQALRPT